MSFDLAQVAEALRAGLLLLEELLLSPLLPEGRRAEELMDFAYASGQGRQQFLVRLCILESLVQADVLSWARVERRDHVTALRLAHPLA